MNFPEYRPRRLRKNELFRRMVRETTLSVDDLIYPLFAAAGRNVRKEIASMPGVFQLSLPNLVREVREVKALGIPAVLLFGIPAKKDAVGSDARSDDGIIQTAVRAIKDAVPDILVVTDVCFCEYTDHGHCGVLSEKAEDLGDRHLRQVSGQGRAVPRAWLDHRRLWTVAIVHSPRRIGQLRRVGISESIVGKAAFYKQQHNRGENSCCKEQREPFPPWTTRTTDVRHADFSQRVHGGSFP